MNHPFSRTLLNHGMTIGFQCSRWGYTYWRDTSHKTELSSVYVRW